MTRDLESLLKLLSHPDRLRLVQALAYRPCTVTDLAEELGLTTSNVSQHLRPMLAKHLVSRQKDGRSSVYQLTQPSMASWLLEGRAFLRAEVTRTDDRGEGEPTETTRSEHLELVAIHAAAQGDIAALARLEHEGVPLDQPDYDGRTPLHLAAAEGRREAVEFLISRGVAREVVDRWGATPAGTAAAAGHVEIAARIRDEPDRS